MKQFLSRYAVLKEVFTNGKYAILALGVAFTFYLLNALVLQWDNLDLVTSQNAFSLFTVGVYYLMTRMSFYSLLVVSLLTGVLLTLLVYRARTIVEAHVPRAGFVSSLGILAGVLLPGCASCGIGLAAALGFSSSLALLPFKGIEISLAAIVLLSIAISMVSQSMTIYATCKVLPKKRLHSL